MVSVSRPSFWIGHHSSCRHLDFAVSRSSSSVLPVLREGQNKQHRESSHRLFPKSPVVSSRSGDSRSSPSQARSRYGKGRTFSQRCRTSSFAPVSYSAPQVFYRLSYCKRPDRHRKRLTPPKPVVMVSASKGALDSRRSVARTRFHKANSVGSSVLQLARQQGLLGRRPPP